MEKENKKELLLYGDNERFGIYQLKGSMQLRDFHFEGIEQLRKRNLLSEDMREILPENYNLVYIGELSDIAGETTYEKLEAIFEKFNLNRPADFTGHSLSVSDIVVLHMDNRNSAHYVDSFGFTEVANFMKGLEQDTKNIPVYQRSVYYAKEHGEIALYRLSFKTNVLCKEAVEASIENSYDGHHGYSVGRDTVKPVLEEFGAERLAFVLACTVSDKEFDGRFSQDNKDWAKVVAPEITVTDFNGFPFLVNSHPALLNGFIDSFRRMGTCVTPLAISDEERKVLKEKVQERDDEDVIRDFKAKTNELFHEINGLHSHDIELAVLYHVEELITKYGLDARVVDFAIIGSRCRGLEREDSDLDVAVELATNEREDVLFDTFHADEFFIGDVRVDINPITKQKTGTLGAYLRQAEDYLSKKKAMEDR